MCLWSPELPRICRPPAFAPWTYKPYKVFKMKRKHTNHKKNKKLELQCAYNKCEWVYISLFLSLCFLCRIRSVSSHRWKDMIKCPSLWVLRDTWLGFWCVCVHVYVCVCVGEQVIRPWVSWLISVNHPLKTVSLKRSQGFRYTVKDEYLNNYWIKIHRREGKGRFAQMSATKSER